MIAILKRPLKIEELHLIGQIRLYHEVVTSNGAIKETNIFFNLNPITCKKEIKMFAPPPKCYNTKPKTTHEKIKTKFTKQNVVDMVNEWITSENYRKYVKRIKNNITYKEKRVIYLTEA